MDSLQLRVRSTPRGDIFDHDAEGDRLRTWVCEAMERGPTPMVAVVLRSDRIDLIGLRPVIEARMRVGLFLAGLTRSISDDAGPVVAVGVMGVLRSRRRDSGDGPGVPMAVAFLEWEDCRWWHWKALVDPDQQQVREDTSTVLCAEDGDALPAAFGRWWSYGRRNGLRVRMARSEESESEQAPPLVH